MLRFLVVDRTWRAQAHAIELGWKQLSAVRYATPERDDVRVVERPQEVYPVNGEIVLEKGPGYLENAQMYAFEQLVALGGARWLS